MEGRKEVLGRLETVVHMNSEETTKVFSKEILLCCRVRLH
jgi:hypothetical protein